MQPSQMSRPDLRLLPPIAPHLRESAVLKMLQEEGEGGEGEASTWPPPGLTITRPAGFMGKISTGKGPGGRPVEWPPRDNPDQVVRRVQPDPDAPPVPPRPANYPQEASNNMEQVQQQQHHQQQQQHVVRSQQQQQQQTRTTKQSYQVQQHYQQQFSGTQPGGVSSMQFQPQQPQPPQQKFQQPPQQQFQQPPQQQFQQPPQQQFQQFQQTTQNTQQFQQQPQPQQQYSQSYVTQKTTSTYSQPQVIRQEYQTSSTSQSSTSQFGQQQNVAAQNSGPTPFTPPQPMAQSRFPPPPTKNAAPTPFAQAPPPRQQFAPQPGVPKPQFAPQQQFAHQQDAPQEQSPEQNVPQAQEYVPPTQSRQTPFGMRMTAKPRRRDPMQGPFAPQHQSGPPPPPPQHPTPPPEAQMAPQTQFPPQPQPAPPQPQQAPPQPKPAPPRPQQTPPQPRPAPSKQAPPQPRPAPPQSQQAPPQPQQAPPQTQQAPPQPQQAPPNPPPQARVKKVRSKPRLIKTSQQNGSGDPKAYPPPPSDLSGVTPGYSHAYSAVHGEWPPKINDAPNQTTTYPSTFKFKEAPNEDAPAKVVMSQPAFKISQPIRRCGDDKWPPRGSGEPMQEEVRQFMRPQKMKKDYGGFFAKNALPHNYAAYRPPPGTQHKAPEEGQAAEEAEEEEEEEEVEEEEDEEEYTEE